MNDHSDKKTLDDLTDRLNQMVKDSKNKVEKELNISRTPIRQTLRKRKNSDVQNSKLDDWLIQKGIISPSPKKKKSTLFSTEMTATSQLKQQCEPVKNRSDNKVEFNKKYSPKYKAKHRQKSVFPTNSNKSDQEQSKNEGKSSRKLRVPKNEPKTNKQSTLNSFVKKDNAKTLKHNDSFDSIDLPTFTKTTKKKLSKSSKQKASFQKYGVILPTVNEILKDKQDIEYRRSKLQCFNPMSEDSLELLFVNEELQEPVEEKGLDCKHLSLDELTNYFNLTVSFLSDIINEKISNHRHQKYFDKNLKVLTLSTNDLTYNTSTIVFSYEQIDHLMSLLKRQFDPNDTKTKYFFQVLLPELCLRIFMKTYSMNFEQAVEYLSERPVID